MPVKFLKKKILTTIKYQQKVSFANCDTGGASTNTSKTTQKPKCPTSTRKENFNKKTKVTPPLLLLTLPDYCILQKNHPFPFINTPPVYDIFVKC